MTRRFLSSISFLLLISATAGAQWRVFTPRDTIFVPANKKPATASKIAPPAGVEVSIRVSGTYRQLSGNPAQFDAGYCMYFPGWNLPQPLRTTPPYIFNSQTYNYGLKYSTNLGLSESWFVPTESTYQSSHIYTSRITGAGNNLQFFIKSHSDANYPLAQDGLMIQLARWTAGIAVKETNVSFGNVYIGESNTFLDSMASYGLDPLQVEKIEIIGADSAAFAFVSQRGKSFTLGFEQTNEIKIIFTPNKRGNATAILRITSKNTDVPSRIININLNGTGLEPQLGIGKREIDFGKVRIGFPVTRNTSIFNNGNANLIIDSLKFRTNASPDSVFGKSLITSIPMTITPNSIGVLNFVASPRTERKYDGMSYIFGNNNLRDSVHLICEGVLPKPELSDDTLFFGTVYSGITVSKPLTLSNKGSWPVSVLLTEIEGPFKAAFSFTPGDPVYQVQEDSSRVFTVQFKPGTLSQTMLRAYMIFYYDDNVRDTVVLIGNEITYQLYSSKREHDFGTVRVGAVKTDTLTVFNYNGSVNFNFNKLDVQPENPFFIQRINFINPQSTLPFLGSFVPLVPGPVSGIVVFNKTNGTPDQIVYDTIFVRGVGAVAKAVFNPTPLNFGIVASNTPVIKPVTLTDSGTLQLKAVRYEITGPDRLDFTLAAIRDAGGAPLTFPFTIDPNQTVTFDVRFFTNARTGAVHRASLCIIFEDSSRDCIPLEGIEETQYVQFATPALDFGKVRLRSTSQMPAQFRNGSNITLSVGKAAITPLLVPFTLLDTLAPIKPNSTYDLGVRFAPMNRGAYRAYLKAEGGDIRTDSIELRGIGAAPIPVAAPAIVNFGTSQQFVTKDEPLIIYNVADDSLKTDWLMKVINIFLRGDKENEFEWRSIKHGLRNTTDSIDISDMSDYVVSFTPNTVRTFHSADLVFVLDDSSEFIVKLIGFDESQILVLGEDSVHFGKVRIGAAPITKDISLVNTWTDSLTAGNVRLMQTGTAYSAAPIGRVRVAPNLTNRTLPVAVSFAPNVRGPLTASLTISGGDAADDTTYLTGIGAEPAAEFTPANVLDFGQVLYSVSAQRSFRLKNIGNWDMTVINVDISGPNAADFTPTIPKQFIILEDSALVFPVTFLAMTPLQAAPRTAIVTFMFDDSTTVTYQLQAIDREPFKTDLRFDNAAARIGDRVYPNLRLMNAIPDTLKVNLLKGEVVYDPSVVELIEIGLGEGLIQAGGWTLTRTAQTPGRFSYELNSTTKFLTNPTSLLRLTFRSSPNVIPGAQTTLDHIDFSYPGRKEVQALLTGGIIIIDSTCGNTHLVAGAPKASYIEQNRPNPFGALSGFTEIPFTVFGEHTTVLLRILDVTGNEKLRLIDGEYPEGRYTIRLDADRLPAGTYFYEYSTSNSRPVTKKLVIGK